MKRKSSPELGSEVALEAEVFERRALRNGVAVVRVDGPEDVANAIASRVKGGYLVAVEGSLAWLDQLLGERGVRVKRLEELDLEELLRVSGFAAVRLAAAALHDTGGVVLIGSARAQLVTTLSDHLFVLLERGLLERRAEIGELVKRSAEQGLGPVYIASGPSSTRDIEHVLVRGATGPRSVTYLIGDGGRWGWTRW
jgi:L-lactate utilization protein LutC